MLGHLYVKSPTAGGAHTDPQRAGPVVSQLPYLRPKFTVQGLCSPCGSAPPLLSLTRIASILALVKLTSSLNYANKAIVICICTASWYAARGGVGWRDERLRIKAPPHTKVPVHTDKHICTETYMYCGFTWWREEATQGPASRLWNISALWSHCVRIYRLQAEWLVQVQSTDKCSALPVRYITGKQTSARVSTWTTPVI